MARDVIVFHGEEGGFPLDSKGGGLFLICMVVASLSLISMVVFACGTETEIRRGGGREGGEGRDGGGRSGGSRSRRGSGGGGGGRGGGG
ncbi:hypothetical protein SLA2020_261300 [Shorea laevis]